MKTFMDFEEHQAMKEKRIMKMKKKTKQDYGYEDDLEFITKKKDKNKKMKDKKLIKNNNFSYEDDYYGDDLYDFDYDIKKIK